MKLDFSNERILAVVAHPDDAELLCAGTLARAKAEGAEIGICVLCDGSKGQARKAIKDLAAVRRREMKAAAKLLGATLFLGGFPDGELVDGKLQRGKLIDIYRKFRPTLVLAHSQSDYHADHRAAGTLAEVVSWFCASGGHRKQTKALAAPPELWWMDTISMHGFTPGFYVDVSRSYDMKVRMLACHQSQLARGEDGDFSPLTELMETQARARGMQADVEKAEAFQIHQAFKRTRAW
jgi:LmbE family N-acetylglucosaminyl deacetylase